MVSGRVCARPQVRRTWQSHLPISLCSGRLPILFPAVSRVKKKTLRKNSISPAASFPAFQGSAASETMKRSGPVTLHSAEPGPENRKIPKVRTSPPSGWPGLNVLMKARPPAGRGPRKTWPWSMYPWTTANPRDVGPMCMVQPAPPFSHGVPFRIQPWRPGFGVGQLAIFFKKTGDVQRGAPWITLIHGGKKCEFCVRFLLCRHR